MLAIGKCAISLFTKTQPRNPVVSGAVNFRHAFRSLLAHRNWKRWVAPTLRELKKRKDKMGPQPLPHRSSFLDWNYSAELYAFGRRLNEDFRSEVLQNALTHESYIAQEVAHQRELGIEDPKIGLMDNRDLAKKGEKLMTKYIQKYLRTALPMFPEEGIQSLRDFLMSDAILGYISSNIGTKDLVLCSDYPVSTETLAVTFKAVVGALSASSGDSQAELFVRDLVITQLADRDVNELWPIEDPMRMLEEIMLREARGTPEPRLINEAGRNTILAVYQVAIYVDKQFMGIGSGETVSIAKEMAAREVLKRLFHTTENMKPIAFNLAVVEKERNVALNQWMSKHLVELK